MKVEYRKRFLKELAKIPAAKRKEIELFAFDEMSSPAAVGIGGRGGIRTHDGLATIPVFETGRFNHSRTLPNENFESNIAKEIESSKSESRISP